MHKGIRQVKKMMAKWERGVSSGFSILLTLVLNTPFSLLLLFIFHVFTILPSHCTSTSLLANTTDLRALLSFKSQISDDPFGSLSSWNDTNTTIHYCEWFGVTCNSIRHPDRVTLLTLRSLGLTGTISPFISNLTFLISLNLSNNNFHGNIPPDLGRLSRLRYLNLSHNYINGEIPTSLTHYCSNLESVYLEANNLSGQIPVNISQCPNLYVINLAANKISGPIPESLGSLAKLTKLNLLDNKLTGGIPPSLGNLSSLLYIDITGNSLEGSIPDTIGKLTNLIFFNTEQNKLSGEIPPSLFNISSINYINLGNNRLSGGLPRDMGNSLPNLLDLDLFYNQIVGPLPITLSNLSQLRWLSLHGNKFVGTMPPNLGLLQYLTALDIGLNQVEARKASDWDFLTSLTNCSNLNILYLSHNNFQGMLPNSVANLSTQLTWLSMAANLITGTIPFDIGKFTKLTVFSVAQNFFTGFIPPTITMLANLNRLDMSQNKFNGQLPFSLGNLTSLTQLILGENNLQGSIPASIGNLQQLNSLNLSHNKFESTLPEQVLGLSSLSQYLDLSHNLFTGPLSAEIGSLKNLVLFDISENRLTGEIPPSISSCQELGSLYMQGNTFEGIVPLILSSLRGMQVLDLSCNNLSGQIPQFFENFQLLHYLNLSFNNFNGQVPRAGIFGNKSAFSVLGNFELCGGIPDLHLKPCDPTNGTKTHRSRSSTRVIIIVVAVFSLLALIVICAASYHIWRKRMKVSPPSESLKESFIQISYAEIHKATDGFSATNLIGRGSFGSVYKGIINNDSPETVAIKVLNLDQRGADKSFMAECDVLRVIRHRNLISIITVCSSVDRLGNDFKALVFEYMSNGSLDDWLHPDEEHGSRNLSLAQRWNIAMDVANALDYLHHHCQVPVLHCDLKPSNVLLDADMRACVGDFGLTRFVHNSISNSSQDPSSSTGIRGSIGYVAPEYGMGGSANTQGDVYSYGVLLLEMFTGKRPTNEIFEQDLNLHKYVEAAYTNRVMDIVDPCIILQDGNAQDTVNPRERMQEGIISIFKLGLSCSKESTYERYDMGGVISELLAIKKIIEG